MKRFDLLLGIYVFCIVVSELMGAKTIPLGSMWGWNFNASVSLLTLPFIFTINDIIIEVFGRERARGVIRVGLVVVALTFLYAAIATLLPPSVRSAPNEAAYDTIFGQSIRFSFASLMAFALSEVTDVFVFARLRARMGNKALWLRNNASNFLAQLIDTIVFMTLAFWAFDQAPGANVAFITGITIPYLLMKWLISVLETPFVYLGVRWLKNERA